MSKRKQSPVQIF